MKINVETTVAAPIEQVWRAYTTPAEIKQWNAASDDWHTNGGAIRRDPTGLRYTGSAGAELFLLCGIDADAARMMIGSHEGEIAHRFALHQPRGISKDRLQKFGSTKSTEWPH